MRICPFQQGVTHLCGLNTFYVMISFLEAYDFEVWQNFFFSFPLVCFFNLSLNMMESWTSQLQEEKIHLQLYLFWTQLLPIEEMYSKMTGFFFAPNKNTLFRTFVYFWVSVKFWPQFLQKFSVFRNGNVSFSKIFSVFRKFPIFHQKQPVLGEISLKTS